MPSETKPLSVAESIDDLKKALIAINNEQKLEQNYQILDQTNEVYADSIIAHNMVATMNEHKHLDLSKQDDLSQLSALLDYPVTENQIDLYLKNALQAAWNVADILSVLVKPSGSWMVAPDSLAAIAWNSQRLGENNKSNLDNLFASLNYLDTSAGVPYILDNNMYKINLAIHQFIENLKTSKPGQALISYTNQGSFSFEKMLETAKQGMDNYTHYLVEKEALKKKILAIIDQREGDGETDTEDRFSSDSSQPSSPVAFKSSVAIEKPCDSIDKAINADLWSISKMNREKQLACIEPIESQLKQTIPIHASSDEVIDLYVPFINKRYPITSYEMEKLYALHDIINNNDDLVLGGSANRLVFWSVCVLTLVDQEIRHRQFIRACSEYIKKNPGDHHVSKIKSLLAELRDPNINTIKKDVLLEKGREMDGLIDIYTQIAEKDKLDYVLTSQRNDLEFYQDWLERRLLDNHQNEHLNEHLNEVQDICSRLDKGTETTDEDRMNAYCEYYDSDLYKTICDAEKMILEAKTLLGRYQTKAHDLRQSGLFQETPAFKTNLDEALNILYGDESRKSTLEKASDYKSSVFYTQLTDTKNIMSNISILLIEYESYVKSSFTGHRTAKLKAIQALRDVFQNNPDNLLMQSNQLSIVFNQEKINLFQNDSLGERLTALLAQLKACFFWREYVPTKNDAFKNQLQVIRESIDQCVEPNKNSSNNP